MAVMPSQRGIQKGASAVAAGTPDGDPRGTRLRGRWLTLIGVAWVVLVAFQVASYLSLFPGYLTLAAHPCQQTCSLTIQEAGVLSAAGISTELYVGALFAITTLNLLISLAISIMLFVRRSDDPMALITGYFVVVLPTTFLLNLAPTTIGYTQASGFPLPYALDFAIGVLQTALLFGMFLIFPTGRFVPRWAVALWLGFSLFATALVVWPDLQGSVTPLWIGFFAAAIYCIGYRYWRISTPSERQQTKWVVFGFLVFMCASLAYWLPTFSPLANTLYQPLSYLGYQLCLPILPLSFFIAILRYRLYDIDVIIRRTLIYGSLTLILALVYVLGVVGSQTVVGRVTHSSGEQQSPLIIVMTTLVIAALFQPLRRRIQAVIDRRFYRSNYDAARTLATFATTLREEVDLPHLADHLLGTVDETMQPTHISLWLRPRQK